MLSRRVRTLQLHLILIQLIVSPTKIFAALVKLINHDTIFTSIEGVAFETWDREVNTKIMYPEDSRLCVYVLGMYWSLIYLLHRSQFLN